MTPTPAEGTRQSTALHRQRRLEAGRSGGEFECGRDGDEITYRYIWPASNDHHLVDPVAVEDDRSVETSLTFDEESDYSVETALATDEESDIFSASSNGRDTSTPEPEFNKIKNEKRNKGSLNKKKEAGLRLGHRVNSLLSKLLPKLKKTGEKANKMVSVAFKPVSRRHNCRLQDTMSCTLEEWTRKPTAI